jgi:hypothetical protein
MRLSLQTLGPLAVAAALLSGPRPAAAEGVDPGAAAVRRNEQTVERLRAELARVNAEVAALKRGPRSLRNDYRLRERMADAEALAQKLTAAESKLRGPSHAVGAAGAPVVASPQASPQDGSVELEAKADLLADQARKLDGEADRLSRAADEMRTRRALRRKAGSWERDPFAGLESSRRNVVALPSAAKQATTSDTTGGMAPTGSVPITLGPTASPPTALAPVTTDSASKGAAEGAAASKTSPLTSSAATDRQAVEQRLYLDPATAAELRHALGAGNAKLDPEALERGAAALRARARALEAQARGLRTQSRAP